VTDTEPSPYSTIVVERDGRIATITLNRPKALNALDSQLMHEIVRAATELDRDPGVAVIILTGSERAFAAGADITEMRTLTSVDVMLDDRFSAWDDFAAIRTPTIAAVAGYALGGGCELAMMCDILIAADTAKFGQPEINLGVIPGLGGSQRLTRAIGKAKAMDLVLTGRTMDAVEAERSGLVARVVPAESLLDEARAIAEVLAAKSVPVLYAAKDAVRAAFETTLAEGLRYERQKFHSLFALDDRTEGMTAFVEKRSAEFHDR
jgi:enoyl-CoA hydratase